MSGRRGANEGDEGDAGNRLLNRLVREPLEVSVRNGQPNVVIDLLQYAVTKGDGGANAGSGARVFELTGGREGRIILALLKENPSKGVPSLQALVARAKDPRAYDAASRTGRAALANDVAAKEPVLALVRQALQACPTCDANDFTRLCATRVQTAMQARIPSFSMVRDIPFQLLVQALAQNCANWVVFPATMLILQILGLLTGNLDQDRALLKEWGRALLATLPNRVFWFTLTFMGGEADRMAKAEETFEASFRQWRRASSRRLSPAQYEQLVSTPFVPRLRNFIYAIGGEGVAQLGTWLQFHQAPRAASAAICAGVVVGALGDAATPEIVAWLLACRTDQILPAIEQYLYKQKGMDRGDVD